MKSARARSLRRGALLLLASGALQLLPPGASAADEKTDPAPELTDRVTASNCDLVDHKSQTQAFTPAAAIPDNNPAGVTFGPIVLPADGMFIDQVVLEMDCGHSWIGDLIVRLSYDENSDDVIDVTSTVICRPGRTGSCGPSGTGTGCRANFTTGAVYRFDDTATNPLPETCADSNIAGGCYLPTGVSASPLSVFRGLTKGGRWWLFVSDNALSDTGTLASWTVYVLNTPVAVAPTSWGRLKVLYR